MLNFIRFIEVIISIQSMIISTMIPIFITLPFPDKFKAALEMPISLQIPIVIIISIIFERNVVFTAFTIYLIIGLFFYPIFHHGGSLGYLLTPNFGYLIGYYPLIQIINKLNKKSKVHLVDFLRKGLIAISILHLVGIIFNLILMIYYNQFDNFFYNFGNLTLGKVGYHYLMLLPISLLIKPINYFKRFY